mgnify:CR=1 FL=1
MEAKEYFQRDPEREAFYRIFYQICQRFNVTWSTATPEVRAFVEEATRVAYEQEKAQATIRLMSEIAKGRRSGEERGCLTSEEIRAHFRARASEEPLPEE